MISHERRCIFVHVPKTAGKSLLGLFGLPEFGRDFAGDPRIEDPYDHVPVSRYVSRPYFEEYFKFAVVRNPWDRLVSAFNYLDRGGSNLLDKRFREQYLASYAGDFRAFVQDLPRFLKTKHFAPQSFYICDGGSGILVDHVGRFEDLSATVALLAARCGIDASALTHRNASPHQQYTDYYDDATRDLVANVYARDIRLFGYQFEP